MIFQIMIAQLQSRITTHKGKNFESKLSNRKVNTIERAHKIHLLTVLMHFLASQLSRSFSSQKQCEGGGNLLGSVSQPHVMLQFHPPAYTPYRDLVVQVNYDINKTLLQAEEHQQTLPENEFWMQRFLNLKICSLDMKYERQLQGLGSHKKAAD